MLTRLHPLMIAFLMLALLGFIVTLVRDPVSVLFTLAVIGVILFAVRNYTKTGRFFPFFTSNSMKRKQSKKQVGIKNAKAEKRRAAFHVIHGSKGKTKEEDDEPKVYH